jgi:hypothetical protein
MVSGHFAEMTLFLRHLGIFYRRLNFPSEGRHAEDFSPEKSDGFGQV